VITIEADFSKGKAIVPDLRSKLQGLDIGILGTPGPVLRRRPRPTLPAALKPPALPGSLQ
jgi:hypothetical protein